MVRQTLTDSKTTVVLEMYFSCANTAKDDDVEQKLLWTHFKIKQTGNQLLDEVVERYSNSCAAYFTFHYTTS